jgi:murein L,D-transpeptidase YcbB/YkuD
MAARASQPDLMATLPQWNAASMRILFVALTLWLAPVLVLAEMSDGAWNTLTAALQAPESSCSRVPLDRQRLTPYYSAAAPVPLWINEHGPNARARMLRTVLQNADREGLSPERYWLAEIEARWQAPAPDIRSCLELLLTAGFDRYSRDVHSGRVSPHEADPTWTLHSPAFDPVAALQAIGSDDEFSRLLKSLPPEQAGYQRLRSALAQYRHVAGQGGWTELPPGPNLTPGDVHAQVPALRARLRLEGDLPRLALSFGTGYDTPLVEAVQQFQRRHGLQPDGIVGARTRAELNISTAERAAQLRRALERWRWLPRNLGDHYILVNTAGFELAVVEGGEAVLRMRSINGTPDQATPSFTATLQTLIINPYWYVPQRIARDRLWPRAQRNTGYLAERGFRVFDTRNRDWQELDPTRLDWKRINGDDTNVRLRQEPGPKNLMGRLSFVFPNPFDIFLHDTPDRALFERDVRTFSEGCVRIENAMALALHTLRQTPEWNEMRIQEEIDALHHRNLKLPEPIPVYVLYLPSWVDADRQVQFRSDVYRRETVLTSYYPAD